MILVGVMILVEVVISVELVRPVAQVDHRFRLMASLPGRARAACRMPVQAEAHASPGRQ
jgi:hypothetical protein